MPVAKPKKKKKRGRGIGFVEKDGSTGLRNYTAQKHR
jgi:hypothetical protein